jgi:hypothetical protein
LFYVLTRPQADDHFNRTSAAHKGEFPKHTSARRITSGIRR